LRKESIPELVMNANTAMGLETSLVELPMLVRLTHISTQDLLGVLREN